MLTFAQRILAQPGELTSENVQELEAIGWALEEICSAPSRFPSGP